MTEEDAPQRRMGYGMPADGANDDARATRRSVLWSTTAAVAGTGVLVGATTPASGAAGEYTATLTVTEDDRATDADSVTATVVIGGFEDHCDTEAHYAHVRAGRAYNPGGYAYAIGSDDNLCLYNTYVTATLKETPENYFEKVESCQTVE